VLLSIIPYSRAEGLIRAEAQTRLLLATTNVAEVLEDTLYGEIARLTKWANGPVRAAVVRGDAARQLSRYLRQMAPTREAYRAVVSVDLKGRHVAGIGEANLVVVPENAHSPQVSFLREGATGMHAVQLAVPILDPTRTTSLGMLVAVLHVHFFGDAIDAALRSTPGRHTPAVMVRSATGLPLYDTAALDARRAPAGDGPADLRSTGLARMPGDNEHLEVVLTNPLPEAAAAMVWPRRALFGLGLSSLSAGVILVILTGWPRNSPISRLTDSLQRLGRTRNVGSERGRLRSAPSEVQLLTTTFRSMIDSLGSAQAEVLRQTRLAFLGEIASNIAHEVRTPLATLKTSAQLLGRPDIAIHKHHELTELIVTEVNRLNTVVSDLADIARPRPLCYRDENIANLIRRAAALFATMAEQQAVQMNVEIEDETLSIRCAGDQLYQVFLNLIRNAFQALAGPGTVTVRASRGPRSVVLEVEDDGPGIPPHVLSTVFKPFVTTKPDGTGLGLSISTGIVKDHGGTLIAENRSGAGARFVIQLPRPKEIE
jgi:signal transduction histidine kinase